MTFDKLITIQTMNASTEQWSTLCESYARVNCLSGSEYWAAAAQQAENTVTFEVRFMAALSALNPQTTRLVFNGQTYDVKSIDNFMFKNRTLKFKAVAHSGR